jgi:hypothetical protein
MIVAAALCPAPPLLARELTGTEAVLPDLRAACTDAVWRLARAAPDVIAVTGAGPASRDWDGGAALDVAAFGGRGFPRGTPGLPAALGLGARLLDEAGYAGPRLLRAIGADEPPAACAAAGRALSATPGRMALLVMADGSARRSRRAPGHLDERADRFDAAVQRAVRDGDLAALAGLDPDLARDLMATGRAAWQVLAAALPRPDRAEVLYADDPFGVAYLVASFTGPAPPP